MVNSRGQIIAVQEIFIAQKYDILIFYTNHLVIEYPNWFGWLLFSFIDPLLGIGSPSLFIESFRMFSFPMNPKTRTSSINSTANFTFERLDLLMSRPQMVFQRHFGSEFTSTKFAIVSYTQMNGSHMLNVFVSVRILGLTFGTFELLASMFGLDMNIQSTSG